MIEISKFQKYLHILNFSRFRLILNCFDLLEDMNNINGDRIYPKYFTELE